VPRAGKPAFILACLILMVFSLIIGCAKSLPPPGGPEDTTPPNILATYPYPGDVNVPLDTKINIVFSEAIDVASAERAVFISPRYDPEPKIKIKSKSIEIEFPGGLKPNKTQVITIGTDLRDAHRVALKQSATLAFSTGPTIDSGKIAGIVFKDNKPLKAVSLALFDTAPENLGTTRLDSLQPVYFTQSGDNGVYTFEYLPPGRYYPVAYEDLNKNLRINIGKEQVGVPFRDCRLNDSTPSIAGIDIRLHSIDTATLEIRSVSVNPDKLVKLRLSNALAEDKLDPFFEAVRIHPDADSTTDVAIIGYTNLKPWPCSDFLIETDNLQNDAEYTLTLDRAITNPAVADSLRIAHSTFTPGDIVDNVAPQFLDSYPFEGAKNISPDSAILYRFSEPVIFDSLNIIAILTDSLGDTTLTTLSHEDSFTLRATPDDTLAHGSLYWAKLDPHQLSDRSGNVMTDSLIAFSYTTIGADTLGQMSGTILFSDSADTAYPVMLSFIPAPAGERRDLTLPVGEHSYLIDLIPGNYVVSAYLDRNDNGVYDYGTIIPYVIAEPFIPPADTIRVRTRFESSAIDLKF